MRKVSRFKERNERWRKAIEKGEISELWDLRLLIKYRREKIVGEVGSCMLEGRRKRNR